METLPYMDLYCGNLFGDNVKTQMSRTTNWEIKVVRKFDPEFCSLLRDLLICLPDVLIKVILDYFTAVEFFFLCHWHRGSSNSYSRNYVSIQWLTPDRKLDPDDLFCVEDHYGELHKSKDLLQLESRRTLWEQENLKFWEKIKSLFCSEEAVRRAERERERDLFFRT